MSQVVVNSQPTSLGFFSWMAAPSWATHIVRFSTNFAGEYAWAEKRGDDYYFPTGWTEIPILLMDTLSGPNAIGWVIEEARSDVVKPFIELMFRPAPAIGSGSMPMFVLKEPNKYPVVKRSKRGEWWHPDFRWKLIPKNESCGGYFADAGYELTYLYRPDDEDPLEAKCVGWKLPRFMGVGWFLVVLHTNIEGKAEAIYACKRS